MKIIKKEPNDNYHSYGYYDDNNNFNYHREDGPAVIYPNGTHFWYVNGKPVGDHVAKWLKDHNIEYDKLSDEDKFALSFFMRSL